MSRGKQLTDEEKRRLVEEWDRSGLSAADFAHSHGVHAETLRLWGRAIRGPLRHRRSRTRPVPRTIEIVEVNGARRTSNDEPRIEVITSSGCRLRLFVDWSPDLVAELIALIEPNS